MQQDPLAALGLFIRKFGQKIDGGFEVFIPHERIMELGSNAQIQVEPDFKRKGFKFKVFTNKTIEGQWSEHKDDAIESGSGPDQLTQADDETPA